MKRIFGILTISCFCLIVYAYKNFQNENVPRAGFVPDEKTAISIAEIILARSYGKEILNQKPFKAHLNKDSTKWIVIGSLKKGEVGGVVELVIQRSDCKILRLTHGK